MVGDLRGGMVVGCWCWMVPDGLDVSISTETKYDQKSGMIYYSRKNMVKEMRDPSSQKGGEESNHPKFTTRSKLLATPSVTFHHSLSVMMICTGPYL